MKTTPDLSFDLFASAHGIDTSSAVALMVAASRGVAGPDHELLELTGRSLLPACHLGLVDDSAVGSSMLEHLLRQVGMIQAVLIGRFGRIDLSVLKKCWHATNDSRPGSGSPAIDRDASRTFHNDALFGITERSNGLSGELDGNVDMKPDETFRRLGIVLRPRFLIESARPGKVGEELGRCHNASGLVVGGRSLEVGHLDGKALSEINELIRGKRIPVPELMAGSCPGATEAVSANFILRGTFSGWSSAPVMEAFHDGLLLRPERQVIPEDLDAEKIFRFQQEWNRFIHKKLDLRRTGLDGETGFSNGGALVEFARFHQDYLDECHSLGLTSNSVCELPRTLLWMFAHLSREEKIIENVFHHAVILRGRHLNLERELRAENEVARLLGLATKLLGRIKDRQPVTRRDLLRSFNIQSKELYVPVLGMMAGAGLIIEEPTNSYRLGPKRDVEASIRRHIAEEKFRFVA